jgi:glycosyltransferase involved in cell wall biosynthesis
MRAGAGADPADVVSREAAMLTSPPVRRLRVGHVTQGLQVGGQEKLLVEFARHADRAHFDLHFISLGGRGPLADSLQSDGWTVTTMDKPTGLRPSLVVRLAWLFRRLQLDVVHTHDDRPLIYGAPAAWLARTKTILHTHHHGRLLHISRRQCWLIRQAARLTNRFVCVSQDSARYMEQMGIHPDKVLTLWNGIDVERFAFRGVNPGGPIVTVARLSPEKGLDVLLRAMAQVLRTESRARLEIAGDGVLRGDLERLTAELRIGSQVRFLGEVADIPALLARASLFVLPSHSEGISLTLLESMARGLPVVTTRVGGNTEVVIDGETGFLVPPDDPAALAARIRQLVNDFDRCQMMGRAGRHRVEAHFDIRRVLDKYERLYRGEDLPVRSRPTH